MSHPTIRFLDRAKETTPTSGSGSISLGGAVAGFVAISGIGSGNSTYYTLQEGNNFEVGIGTYNSVGNVLSRNEVFLSSSSNNKIDLAGGATVFLTYPADKAVVKTSGNLVGIGTDPEYQLEVSGTGSFNTVRWADGTTQTTAATDTTYTAGTGLTLVGTTFNTDGTGYFTHLGIGTGSPTYQLDVAGDMGVDEYIYHNGDGDTFIRFASDLVNLVAGGASAIKLDKSTDKIQLNNSNQDLDIQIMADDGEVILHTDAATNNVGIGITDPGYDLEVSGTGSFNTVRWADGTIQVTSATGDISTVSGLTVTNANNIASTGATNAAAIAGKDNYQYWTATDGDATSNISTTEDVKITGAGQVTVSLVSGNPSVFTVSGAAAGGGAPTDAQYVTLALDGDLSDERVLTASTGVHIVDGGANGNVAVSVSGSTTSQLGIVQLQDSATNGTTDKAITPNAVYDISGALSSDIQSTGESNYNLIRSYVDTSDNATFNNLTAQGNLTVSGTLTYLDSTTVTIADKQLELASNSGTAIGNDAAVNDGGIVVKSTDSDKKWTWLDATDAWTSTENIKLNSSKKIIFGDNTEQTTSPTGDIATVSGLTVTNASNIASTGATNAAAIATKAPNDAQYVTLATDGDLSAERVLTPSTGVHIVDGGANGNVTVSVSGSTTSQLGIVQLQDSATDGTTDKAITPNAVYDISGVLSTSIASTGATNAASIATNTANISTNTTNIASTGATNAADINTVSGLLYGHWKLQGDSATTTNIDKTETVQFTGAGGTIVTLGGTDNRVVTISGSGSDTTYTAGTGLSLTGTEFNVSGIDGSMIVNGSVTNADLTNSSVTITAGTGLSNGGEVDLGASIIIDADAASTSSSGVVRLQDSATDGTVDRAITPNAVYDVSGILQSSIDGKDNYQHWTLKGGGASTTNVDATETVQFTGAGTTTVALGGADSRTVTISGSGSDYTAGTGLSLAGTEFNVSGIDSSMIVNGSIANADLANSSITVTAGTGLAGGGSVSLGGTVSLDTSETGYFEKLGINDTSPDAMIDVVSDSTTTIGLILEMAAGGDTSVNPFEIRDNGSNVKASFDSEGDLSCGAVSGSGANWVLGRTDISPTIKVATGGNNLNIRNVNTDKDINFDVSSGQGAINIRDYPLSVTGLHFKMGRDSDGTGMYIRSRDDTSILTQWQSSGGTPVAMVNPTGAISGKHIIFPDGTTQATAATAGGGAPTDAQYITLALDGDLSAERVLAASTGIHIVDGGANGNVTVSVSGSTTSQLGIVQLQDSATDGTTDKAITPNAVYDISGVLSTSIASTGATNAANIAATGATNAAAIAAKDNYQYWTALDNTSNTANINTTEDVKFSGVGNVTVTLASGDPTIVTVSGTAGAGGGSPGGSDTQVQFNDSSSFGGDSDLTWNKTTNILTVAGHIAATTKSFLIDHPVKENKKLQYASLEGPENGVYVRGHTTSHVIELPDYWVSLVDPESITVHLTAKGKPQPSLCVNRVSANKVYLSSDQHISAYYTVSATRKDVPPLEVEI